MRWCCNLKRIFNRCCLRPSSPSDPVAKGQKQAVAMQASCAFPYSIRLALLGPSTPAIGADTYMGHSLVNKYLKRALQRNFYIAYHSCLVCWLPMFQIHAQNISRWMHLPFSLNPGPCVHTAASILMKKFGTIYH
jgi:hypothetical protein